MLIALGRFDKALGDFDEALAIRPDYADALHASAVTSLRLGDFSNGWARYEHRWGIAKDAPKRRLKTTYPVWKGQNVRGKRMIVFEEQGLGDVIQFSRYLRPLSTLGAQVTFLVRPEMQRVLRTLDQSVRFVGHGAGRRNVRLRMRVDEPSAWLWNYARDHPNRDALSQCRTRAGREMAAKTWRRRLRDRNCSARPQRGNGCPAIRRAA